MKTRLPHSVDLTNFTQKRPKSTRTVAFTRIELAMVVAVLFILATLMLLLPSGPRALSKASRIDCVNNLKQIGTAYRIWANDHVDQYPPQAELTNSGWNALISRGNAGAYLWTNYVVMSKQLGLSTKVLICPTDERMPAADFSQITNNLSLSYFVGVGADDTNPQGILGGDRNLAPGTVSQNDYGYSPANGQGNDVFVTNPVCWSLKMHSAKNTVGAGNILLADGSAQQVTSAGFRQNWLKPLLEATNHIPVRLIFP